MTNGLKVVALPVQRTPTEALQMALELDFKEVAIIGYDTDNSLIVRTSFMKRRDALWLAEHFKRYAMESDE